MSRVHSALWLLVVCLACLPVTANEGEKEDATAAEPAVEAGASEQAARKTAAATSIVRTIDRFCKGISRV